MKFLHVMIRVKNIEESLKFYQGLFDLTVTRKLRLSDCDLYFLADGHGEVQIELTYNDETPDGGYNIGNGFGHFAFEINSMDDFSQKLKNFGYEYLYEPFNLSAAGSTIAFVKDPDGYEIEIIEHK